jgi:hypothetical protein
MGVMGKLRLTLAALLCAIAAPNTQGVTKVQSLIQQLEVAERTGARVAFTLTEDEYNAYLAWALKYEPRPGVDSVKLKFFPDNYVSTLSVVDLDAVQQWKPDMIPTLLRPLMRGRRSFWVDFRFKVADGMLTYTIEKAYVENVRVPAVVVQEVIRLVAAKQPEKFDATKPLEMPYGVKRLWTEQGKVSGNN